MGFFSPAGGEPDRNLLGCGIFCHPLGKPYPQHQENFPIMKNIRLKMRFAK
jgi:hypothetical protein